MGKYIPLTEKKDIVEFYKTKPMPIQDVCDKFGYSIPTIIKILDSFKVKRYSKYKLFSPELNESYFENINSEKKAYFLGLIIADGCIHMTKGRSPMLAISLKAGDEYILEEFKKELHSNKKITNDGRGCFELQILSRRIVNSLAKLGLKERKSGNELFPKNIDTNLINHVIRGIIDGDGNYSFISMPHRKVHCKAIRLCGSKELLSSIVEYLYSYIKIDKVNLIKESSPNLYSISYRKNASLIKLIEYLYRDATIYLKRKKLICDLIYNEVQSYMR